LKDKVVKGAFWVFGIKIIGYIFSFVRITILGRLLLPSDFGIMGIALLTISIFETFTQVGFRQALIQKKEGIEKYLDSAWTFLIIRGFFIYLLIFFFSYFSSSFFKTPEANAIIKVFGLSIIISSFTNIGVVYFQKEFEFNKQFFYEFLGSIMDFIISITFVIVLRNVWALVIGALAGHLTRCIVSFIIIPYKPKFNFNIDEIKELWDFGRWATLSNILIFFSTQGDDIFVGRFLGSFSLGLYQMAYRISNMPATEITHVISSVSFPAYSKLQDENERLRNAYLKIYQMTSFFSFLLAGLIFTLSDDFIRLFLTSKWEPAIPSIKILSIEGLLRSIAATTGPIFYAIKKPKMETFLQFIRFLILIIFIYPLTSRYGISGTSFCVLLSVLVSTIGFIIMCRRLINFNLNTLLRISFFSFICAFFMPFLYNFIKKFTGINVFYLEFFILAFLIVIIYSFIFILFSRFMYINQIKLIKEVCNEFFKKT